jgi:hypothetical protein
MKNDVCEVKNATAQWREIDIAEAKLLPDTTRKRCPSCMGAVYIYPKPEQFEHSVAHTGCPRSKYNYTGKPSPHPQAVE